ncbi:uncharacterized protein LOC117188657 [Drosophila miranda]|uniref:uncharacterized protein LOC117188657 n=1 Tax=Drosophila miranda TaxID=7229 RepID=UPI00143F1229|nr:uncharacterized protein LOC117188657 [Drosophila miranda]
MVYLRKNLAKFHRFVDRVLGPLYNFQCTAADWDDTAYPPVHKDVKSRILREVQEVEMLVGCVCSYPATPFTTLNRLTSTDLELWGNFIVGKVGWKSGAIHIDFWR